MVLSIRSVCVVKCFYHQINASIYYDFEVGSKSKTFDSLKTKYFGLLLQLVYICEKEDWLSGLNLLNIPNY